MVNPIVKICIILGTILYILGHTLDIPSLNDYGFLIYSALIIYTVVLFVYYGIINPMIWLIKHW
jgi:hypothetical protein